MREKLHQEERGARKKLFSIVSFPRVHISECLLQRDSLPACWQEDPVWLCLDIISLILLFIMSWNRASEPEQPWGCWLPRWCVAPCSLGRIIPHGNSTGAPWGHSSPARSSAQGVFSSLLCPYKAGVGWQRGCHLLVAVQRPPLRC